MQIVIDIPKHIYEHIKEVYEHSHTVEATYSYIYHGTPLPKGHGDLKDMGNLKYVFDLTRDDPIYSGKDIARAIKSMKSIIEADTESEE